MFSSSSHCPQDFSVSPSPLLVLWTVSSYFPTNNQIIIQLRMHTYSTKKIRERKNWKSSYLSIHLSLIKTENFIFEAFIGIARQKKVTIRFYVKKWKIHTRLFLKKL